MQVPCICRRRREVWAEGVSVPGQRAGNLLAPHACYLYNSAVRQRLEPVLPPMHELVWVGRWGC